MTAILKKKSLCHTPWVELVEKEVKGQEGSPNWSHYSLSQNDYVSVLARTPSGKILVVRQYRPAIEKHTYEFPSGLLEVSETPESCASRELLEECGVTVTKLVHLTSNYPDVGRLQNRLHSFYAEVTEPTTKCAEAGIEIEAWSEDDLKTAILNGKFCHQLHVALLTLAQLKNCF